MVTTVNSLISLLNIPLMLFQYFAGILAFVWLIWLGQFSFVFYAFVVSMIAPFAMGFALMIPLIFSLPALWLKDKGIFGKIFSVPLLLLSTLCNWVLLGSWGLLVFREAINEFNLESSFNPDNLLPYLVAAYSVTTGPLTYMATKEGSNSQPTLDKILFVIRLASMWLVLAFWLRLAEPAEISVIYFLIFAISFFISAIFGIIPILESPPIFGFKSKLIKNKKTNLKTKIESVEKASHELLSEDRNEKNEDVKTSYEVRSKNNDNYALKSGDNVKYKLDLEKKIIDEDINNELEEYNQQEFESDLEKKVLDNINNELEEYNQQEKDKGNN